jgi:uncharacterized membrane protein (UPF0127 family)
MKERLTAINLTRGATLADHARVADNLWTRLVGLLRDRGLAEGEGLWIKPCNSIHSFFMKFVFDAVFLDKDLRVVHLMPEMPPGKTSRIILSAKSVLELPAGAIARSGTQLGDQFEMRIDRE